MVGEVSGMTEASESAGLANWPADLDLHIIARNPMCGLADKSAVAPAQAGALNRTDHGGPSNTLDPRLRGDDVGSPNPRFKPSKSSQGALTPRQSAAQPQSVPSATAPPTAPIPALARPAPAIASDHARRQGRSVPG